MRQEKIAKKGKHRSSEAKKNAKRKEERKKIGARKEGGTHRPKDQLVRRHTCSKVVDPESREELELQEQTSLTVGLETKVVGKVDSVVMRARVQQEKKFEFTRTRVGVVSLFLSSRLTSLFSSKKKNPNTFVISFAPLSTLLSPMLLEFECVYRYCHHFGPSRSFILSTPGSIEIGVCKSWQDE